MYVLSQVSGRLVEKEKVHLRFTQRITHQSINNHLKLHQEVTESLILHKDLTSGVRNYKEREINDILIYSIIRSMDFKSKLTQDSHTQMLRVIQWNLPGAAQ